jgi:2-haloacid dehalogenase
MYDIILIDLDNTILDFDAAERDSFIKIIEKAGLNYTDDLLQKYKEINTALWSALEQGKISKEVVLNTRFHKLFQLYGIVVDGRAWEKKYRFYLDNSSGLIPHAEYTLTELKKMGKKIYSASNGVYNTQLKRLSNAGIIDLFDGHFISDRIKHEKPSPFFFEYCIKNIRIVPNSSILMVGDSPTSDIIGAMNAGIDSCFYKHSRNITCTFATYTISNISDLLDIV